MAKGTLDEITGEFTLESLLLIETSKSKTKNVRVNSDDLRRCREAYKALTAFMEDVDIVCVEIPVGSQSARAMASYGACIGILSSVSKPLIQVTAKEVKLHLSGSVNASKDKMIKSATSLYPDGPWLTRTVKGTTIYLNKNEHLADAVGSIHAGVLTEQFAGMVAILKGN